MIIIALLIECVLLGVCIGYILALRYARKVLRNIMIELEKKDLEV
jgi:hypothetical protein